IQFLLLEQENRADFLENFPVEISEIDRKLFLVLPVEMKKVSVAVVASVGGMVPQFDLFVQQPVPGHSPEPVAQNCRVGADDPVTVLAQPQTVLVINIIDEIIVPKGASRLECSQVEQVARRHGHFNIDAIT